MACCSHIDKDAPKGFCDSCANPLQPRPIYAEPLGRPMLSINNAAVESTGLTHAELVNASQYVVNEKFFFVVFPNGMKLHPSVL